MSKSSLALLIVGLLFFAGLPFLAGGQGSQEASGLQETTGFEEPSSSQGASDVQQPGRAQVVACDDISAQLTARAYVLSIPLVGQADELLPLMEENPAHFVPDGGTIRCMRALGNTLETRGLAQFGQFNGDGAQERFGNDMPPELAHLPGQVDDSLRSLGSDQATMGEELRWLARVLPPAAQGDFDPYNAGETTSRRAMAGVLPMYQLLCQIDPGNCQLMRAMFQEMIPDLQQQIYSLARQGGS